MRTRRFGRIRSWRVIKSGLIARCGCSHKRYCRHRQRSLKDSTLKESSPMGEVTQKPGLYFQYNPPIVLDDDRYGFFADNGSGRFTGLWSVSYTHLTLPT